MSEDRTNFIEQCAAAYRRLRDSFVVELAAKDATIAELRAQQAVIAGRFPSGPEDRVLRLQKSLEELKAQEPPHHYNAIMAERDKFWDELKSADGMIAELRRKLAEAKPVGGNARLIAAAPELLAACKAVLKRLENPLLDTSLFSDNKADLRAAIAKAEGKP